MNTVFHRNPPGVITRWLIIADELSS
jgi:hypothetical protein